MLLASLSRLVCVIPMNEVHTQHALRAMLAYFSINGRLKMAECCNTILWVLQPLTTFVYVLKTD